MQDLTPPPIILWTAPRCCGTAFELMMEARGDHHIETNVFDAVFYYGDGAGTDRPETVVDPAATSFGPVYSEFMARAHKRRTFLRNAAYAVMNHCEEVDWHGAQHCFLIRDPRYALPSHRSLVADITPEEAGYRAQFALFRHLTDHGHTPLVLDAHELMNEPERLLRAFCAQLQIPWLPHALRWPAGFRERWSMWRRWKQDAAHSSGFVPFRRDAHIEKQGAADPLFSDSWKYYWQIFTERMTLPDQEESAESATISAGHVSAA